MVGPIWYVVALSVASPSYTPAPSTAERAEIADAVRLRLRTDQRIVFSHLRITQHRRERYAFAVLRPRSGASLGPESWLVLTNHGDGWVASWGIHGDLTYNCGAHARAHATTMDLARRVGADAEFLPPQFAHQNSVYGVCNGSRVGD